MKAEKIKKFQVELLEWYDHHARILPWRNDPSPYRVWISEIMLQQTRVETVKPYFDRFINEVPTIEALANISEDKLLKLWEGLGYYSRAMNLKKAANIIVEKFYGQIPSDIKDLRSLPGIGSYTSGAIGSIAFGIRVPAVDGNVFRVMTRITNYNGDIASQAVKKEIENRVKDILPEVRVGDFNQGLIELGAMICLPKDLLKCSQCPVQPFCEGYRLGTAVELPVKSKQKKRKNEKRTVFVMDYEGSIALRQRPSSGLLANLWEFPNVEGHLSYKECEERIMEWGMTAYRILPMKSSKHIFTHLEWHMIGYYISIQDKDENPQFVWVREEEIKQEYSIPTAFKTYHVSVNENSLSYLFFN